MCLSQSSSPSETAQHGNRQIRYLDAPPARSALRPLRLLHWRSQSHKQRFTSAGRERIRICGRWIRCRCRSGRWDGAGQWRLQGCYAEFEVRFTGINTTEEESAARSRRVVALSKEGYWEQRLTFYMRNVAEVNTATPSSPNSRTKTIGK